MNDTWEGTRIGSPTGALDLQCDDSGDHQQAESRQFWLGDVLVNDLSE